MTAVCIAPAVLRNVRLHKRFCVEVVAVVVAEAVVPAWQAAKGRDKKRTRVRGMRGAEGR